MSTLTHSHPDASAYLQRGIAALKGGDIASATTLLQQSLAINPHQTDAWLWLSGTTTDPHAQRECLETILSIDASHAVARRGLALLDVTHPVPTSQVTPPARPPESITLPLPESVAAQPESIALPAPSPVTPPATSQPEEQDIDLPLIIAPSPNTYTGATQDLTPPPTLPLIEPMDKPFTYGQAFIEEVTIQAIAKGKSKEDICRMLCHTYGLAWADAEQLHTNLHQRKRGTIARQSVPYLLTFSTIMLLAGLLLIGYVGVRAISADQTVTALGWFGYIRSVGLVLLSGLSSLVGGIVGYGQALGSFRLKDQG